jgi:hypothetical protein
LTAKAFDYVGARWRPRQAQAGEIAVDIDRKNRILGNPFILRDPNDKAARARESGRTDRLHVLVLAQAMSRNYHHRQIKRRLEREPSIK